MSLARWNKAVPSRLFGLLMLLLLLAVPSLAPGQPAAEPTGAPAAGATPATPAAKQGAAAPARGAALPPDSWAGQLEMLSRWVEERGAAGECAERCYALDRLRITGAVGEGPLQFELSGGVLADGPVAVPLFGPPEHVRIEAVLDDGRPASRREAAPISFEEGHYYLWTAARRFVLRGTLSLEGDLTLLVAGPLNSFEADVTGGTVAEGARLSGLSEATLHFSPDGGAAAESAGPTVFQLSRAVRVGREIGFEYRLVMRSGSDLGVVRLPLAFGEKVLDVAGASGFRIEGSELVLPTSGRSAEMKITGTLPKVGAFSPDPRSAYEWWLFESDAEHRLTVKGDARQVDAAESPIPRTQATSRLLLVQRGQRVEVNVEPLAGVEVLAAVVREHRRTLVLTERGDLVADDSLSYENNGIDYLTYAPGGRPIYLATDAKAQRIMHQGAAAEEVLVPLQTGSHTIQVQSLAQASVRPLGGSMELPMPSYPLTASQLRLTVGLPERVLPLALLGGDRPVWFADTGDAVAVVIGFVAAWIAVRPGAATSRGRRRALRALGGLVMAGLWFVAPATFVALLVGIATAAAAWLVGRLFRGTSRAVAMVVLLGAGGLALLIGLFAVSAGRYQAGRWRSAYETAENAASAPSSARRAKDDDQVKGGGSLAPGGAVLEGVTPVALGLPSYARNLHVSRELVTRDRAFRPVLVYTTSAALVPLALLWLAGVAVLLNAHRAALMELYRRAATRLARRPEDGHDVDRRGGGGRSHGSGRPAAEPQGPLG
ncbi:hypothetical protein [Sorangium sp. So ce1182]|uniref:hypothetical protein n=1 Tax=Sorangium sp. So ce1182 TaxID=3133334 RepID=UPI003F5FDAFE